MKPTRSFVFGAAMAAAALGSAQDGARIETELTLELSPKYVWHGLNLVNDWVFQPGVVFSRGNWSASVWGNMELTGWNRPNYPENPRGRFTEIDLVLELAGTWGDAGWTVGVVDYQYPGTGAERYSEGVATWQWESLPGSPSLAVFAGLNQQSGTYATLGLSHSLPVTLGSVPSVDLGLEVTVGDRRCNRFLYDFDGSGVTDLHVTAGFEMPLGGAWSVAPTVHYTRLMQPGLLRGEPRRENAWVSVAATVRF